MLAAEQRRQLEDAVAEIKRRWSLTARPSQRTPPGSWTNWLILAGRGFGKTRTGGEFVKEQIEAGRSRRVLLVGATAADVRDVMIEGESGLMSLGWKPGQRPFYEPSKRKVSFWTGAIAKVYSAEEPERLRGPQGDLAWCDELAAWEAKRRQLTWDNLMFALRLGQHPRNVITTTPKPQDLIRDLVAREGDDVFVTRGSTYENVDNLAPAFRKEILSRYEGTRIGRQELYAEILDDVEGALWTRAMIDEARKSTPAKLPDMERIVVMVDPAGSHKPQNAETGIVVVGRGVDGRGYVLEDRSCRLSPNGWARRAVDTWKEFKADRMLYESNYGGELVEGTIRTVSETVPLEAVDARRGKILRAEPVAALYEQGRVSHVKQFKELEDQMCTYTAESEKSPDRLDALVHGLTHLFGGLEIPKWKSAPGPPIHDPKQPRGIYG